MDFIKKNRMWITLGGLALAIIACFLPFAKASVFGYSRVLQLMHFQTDILPLCDKGFILSSFCYFCVVQLCTLWYNNVVRL